MIAGEEQHQRPSGLGPFRRHSVARQIAAAPGSAARPSPMRRRTRGWRWCSGRRWCRTPRRGARARGTRAPGPTPAPPAANASGGISSVVTMELPSSSTLMIIAAVPSIFFVFSIRPAVSRLRITAALDQRHYRDTGFEPRQPQRKLREYQEGGEQHHHRAAVLRVQLVPPARDVLRMLQHFEQRPADDGNVQHQVDADDADGEADGFLEPLEENRREQARGERASSRADGGRPCGKERITDDVRRRIGGRQCDGDDEVGGGKPSRQRTKALPRHRGSSSSSIEMLPCPFGLFSATLR